MNRPSSGSFMFSQSDQYGGRPAGVAESGTSKLPCSETLHSSILQVSGSSLHFLPGPRGARPGGEGPVAGVARGGTNSRGT